MHLQPLGRPEALRIFHDAGGTHAILCHMPYAEAPIRKGKDFQAAYEITLRLAAKGMEETPVKLFPALGPYPVLLLRIAEKQGLAEAVSIMKEGMEIAQKYVIEGKAVALGEIGRPHFPVSDEIWDASNEVMSYGMSLAKEAGCPVILHTEDHGTDTMRDLARIADSSGLPRSKTVKHFAPPLITEEENFGIFPSVQCHRKEAAEALAKGTRFVLETDYVDDPERPSMVLDIKTVPKRTYAMLASGKMTEDQAYAVHKDNPEKLYGIEISL